MRIDKKLHQTFIAQINSMLMTLSKQIDQKGFTSKSAQEYQKQFYELKNSILRVDQYNNVNHLLETKSNLPGKLSFFYSLLFLLRPRYLGSNSYNNKIYTYFTEIHTNLSSVLSIIKYVEID